MKIKHENYEKKQKAGVNNFQGDLNSGAGVFLMINSGAGTLIAPITVFFPYRHEIFNVLEMVEPNKRPLWPIITITNRYNVTNSLYLARKCLYLVQAHSQMPIFGAGTQLNSKF